MFAVYVYEYTLHDLGSSYHISRYHLIFFLVVFEILLKCKLIYISLCMHTLLLNWTVSYKSSVNP